MIEGYPFKRIRLFSVTMSWWHVGNNCWSGLDKEVCGSSIRGGVAVHRMK